MLDDERIVADSNCTVDLNIAKYKSEIADTEVAKHLTGHGKASSKVLRTPGWVPIKRTFKGLLIVRCR